MFGRLPRSLASPKFHPSKMHEYIAGCLANLYNVDDDDDTATHTYRLCMKKRRVRYAPYNNPHATARRYTQYATRTHATAYVLVHWSIGLVTRIDGTHMNRWVYKQSAEKQGHHSVTVHQQLIFPTIQKNPINYEVLCCKYSDRSSLVSTHSLILLLDKVNIKILIKFFKFFHKFLLNVLYICTWFIEFVYSSLYEMFW